ncbi:MAG: SH3 domain-containing protein [Anaerolineae bacterium]|nr:SH3 domain-containing protein [Anaerolineae bacterium]
MAGKIFLVSIRGIPSVPDVNIRSGPGASNSIVVKLPKGTKGLVVLGVNADAAGAAQQGKVFQWLNIQVAAGQTGWVRDDLVEVEGDGTAFGYGVVAQPVLAFSLQRVTRRPTTRIPASSPPPEAMRSASEFIPTRSTTTCIATIVGIPEVSTVNIRSGPGLAHDVVFQAPKGLTSLNITEVRPDEKGERRDGKVFQWFRIAFHDGKVGWARDDLITIQGDCDQLGYDDLSQPVTAFSLKREIPVMIQGSKPTTPPPDQQAPGVKPTEPVLPDTQPVAAAGCSGTVISSVPAKMRAGANTTFAVLTELPAGTRGTIVDIRPQEGGGAFRWVRVEAQGQSGWVREDLLSFSGDCARFNLLTVPGDLFPAPMKRYVWTQGYQGTGGHMGWDIALEGEAVFSAPSIATVIRAHTCSRCTEDKPSALSQGIPLNDPRVINDPAWGWGFGNHTVIRYANDRLPDSTRQQLANAGLPGGHLFVVYAHLKEMTVRQDQQLIGETRIGSCGNTGNSTGTHLHLEVRAGANLEMGPWMRLKLMDPAILFSR